VQHEASLGAVTGATKSTRSSRANAQAPSMSIESASLDGRNKSGVGSKSQGSSLQKPLASACGPSTDEVCCIFETGRSELDDFKYVCK
jgi:hypothetical protein